MLNRTLNLRDDFLPRNANHDPYLNLRLYQHNPADQCRGRELIRPEQVMAEIEIGWDFLIELDPRYLKVGVILTKEDIVN